MLRPIETVSLLLSSNEVFQAFIHGETYYINTWRHEYDLCSIYGSNFNLSRQFDLSWVIRTNLIQDTNDQSIYHYSMKSDTINICSVGGVIHIFHPSNCGNN